MPSDLKNTTAPWFNILYLNSHVEDLRLISLNYK
jgi:hypothetical protein